LPSSLSRLPGDRRNQPPPAKPAEDSPNDDKRSAPGEDQSGGRQNPHASSEHVSKDLDLRALLNSGKSSGLVPSEGAGASSRETEAAVSSARSREDQNARRDDVNVSVFSTASPIYKSPGLGDSFASRNGLSAPGAAPTLAPTPPSPSLNNSLERNLGGGLSPARSGADSSGGRAFNNPNSLYPPALSTDPYFNRRPAFPGLGSPSAFPQQPPADQSSSASSFDRFRIPSVR
jgi:hypothetical protein